MVLSPSRKKTASQDAIEPAGGVYRLWGKGARGGIYNSHFVSAGVVGLLGVFGVVSWWMVAWLSVCLVVGIMLDPKPLRAKIKLKSVGSQVGLYSQVLVQAALNALPWYALAFGIYLCVAPLLARVNLGFSTFLLLYGFYMVDRVICLTLHMVRFAREERQGDEAKKGDFYQGANLKDLPTARRHVLWSFFIGNIGLAVRCSSFFLTVGLFELGRQTVISQWDSPVFTTQVTTFTWVAIGVFAAGLFFNLKSAMLIYYRTHRTFHVNPALYDSVHGVHHRGVYPTRLDSGTISPFEFFITEMAFPLGMLVPNWWWVGAQIVVAYTGHFPGHDAKKRSEMGEHHLDHHRYFNVNFGLTAAEDKKYGTMRSA